jgi:hypothetical protein
MTRLRVVLARVLALFSRGVRDARRDDEIQSHLDLLADREPDGAVIRSVLYTLIRDYWH